MDQGSGEIVDGILKTALWIGASDVHFDPFCGEVRVLFRLHGRIVAADQVSDAPGRVQKSALQRLKVLAKMSLGDQRRPQDGQLRLETEQGPCDVRVSTIMTVAGERIVARIFAAEMPWYQLAGLGMSISQEESVRECMAKGGGMVICAGRIGAGKSTTMHALLQERAACGDAVLTIEDPVERKVKGFQQVEVAERTGLTFAEGLRAAVRQDPDVLMVGEIRDATTAQIAVRAGMTGHLLITSIHADDPTQAISRLLELGIPQSLIGDSVRLVIWQRLVKVRCDNCLGKGCPNCMGVGVTGRRAEFKLLDKGAVMRVVYSGAVDYAVPHVIRQDIADMPPLGDRKVYRAYLQPVQGRVTDWTGGGAVAEAGEDEKAKGAGYRIAPYRSP